MPVQIVEWATDMAKAPDRIVRLDTAEAVKAFTESTSGVFVVGFFETAEHAEMYTAAAEK